MTKDPVLVSQRTRSRKKQKLDFYRLALADKDIRTALYTCDAFIELIRRWQEPKLPYEVSEAFFAAILVSYSRPFTENNFPGVLPKRWRRFAGKALQGTHDEMLKNRHSLFAHTDAEIHRMTIIPDGCLPKSIGPKPPQTAYMIRGVVLQPESVVRYRAVCADPQERLEKASQQALADLYGGMELPNREFSMRFDDGL
jgi:hypothetical protein